MVRLRNALWLPTACLASLRSTVLSMQSSQQRTLTHDQHAMCSRNVARCLPQSHPIHQSAVPSADRRWKLQARSTRVVDGCDSRHRTTRPHVGGTHRPKSALFSSSQALQEASDESGRVAPFSRFPWLLIWPLTLPFRLLFRQIRSLLAIGLDEISEDGTTDVRATNGDQTTTASLSDVLVDDFHENYLMVTRAVAMKERASAASEAAQIITAVPVAVAVATSNATADVVHTQSAPRADESDTDTKAVAVLDVVAIGTDDKTPTVSSATSTAAAAQHAAPVDTLVCTDTTPGFDTDVLAETQPNLLSAEGTDETTLTTALAVPKGNRWAVSAPDIDMSGTWAVITTDQFKNDYDNYLKGLGQPYLVRSVALGIIDMTTEEITQSDNGRSLLLHGKNIRGVWDRTLVTSGALPEHDDYTPLHVPVMTADSEQVMSESWWEDNGTVHVSWLRGIKKYGGGSFESRRYLEEDGNVYVCESTFHKDDATADPVRLRWRFRRQPA